MSKQDLSLKCSAWKSFVLVSIAQSLVLWFLVLGDQILSPQSWRSLHTKSQPLTVPGSLRKSFESLVFSLRSPQSPQSLVCLVLSLLSQSSVSSIISLGGACIPSLSLLLYLEAFEKFMSPQSKVLSPQSLVHSPQSLVFLVLDPQSRGAYTSNLSLLLCLEALEKFVVGWWLRPVLGFSVGSS